MTGAATTNWRLLEAAIVDIARGEGYELAEVSNSGDKFMQVEGRCGCGCNGRTTTDINLTEFARSLASRFPPTAVQEKVS